MNSYSDPIKGNIQLGPLLDEDAQLLQAVIKMTNPKVVVEFGYFWGKSANAMLAAMDADAELHSFDNTKDAGHAMAHTQDARFNFYPMSQDEFWKTQIDKIDFVFLDASHDMELNKNTFLQIKDKLNPKAIIAVHDTGTWIGGNVFDAEAGYLDANGNWVHCPGEIDFVNWLKANHKDFEQIHFHSSRQIRHGITLLQRYEAL
ncbi:COG4122 Predicted O-methyltransferase [uncultured Caudovirales phage]|uniref:COG4122 Predicted O-methyltransferase n=1 Tax=uncultured Caudovirales phage TaxID=2100421 RepID=A0A6J5N1C1_9CAUD|nr:COG4122 Predicted O-methyltransferase [uncultured Caudovirales phage]